MRRSSACRAAHIRLNRVAPNGLIDGPARAGALRNGGAAGANIFGVTLDPHLLHYWSWDGVRVTPHGPIDIGECLHLTLRNDGSIVYVTADKANRGFIQVGNGDGEPGTTERSQMPVGWWCRQIESSCNGQYTAIGLDEDVAPPPPDRSLSRRRLRIGLIGPSSRVVRWVATLTGGENIAYNVRSVLPSDDGTLVAVGGWDNGCGDGGRESGQATLVAPGHPTRWRRTT